MKKRIICVALAVLSMFSFSGCGVRQAKFSIEKDYYEYEQFQIENLDTLFKGTDDNTQYVANVGEVLGKSFTLTLPKASTVKVEITAKGSKEVKNNFNINVVKQAYSDLYSDYDEKVKKYMTQSAELMDAVIDNYWNSPATLGLHYFPNYLTGSDVPDGMKADNSTAYVWPYTEMAAALWRLTSINPNNAKQIHFYRQVLEGFEYYLADRSDYHAYVATRANSIGAAAGDTYYDDNIWIVREFLNAYEVLGDEEYYNKTLSVCEYIWSGWAEDEIGGIYWLEQKRESRNACSNAPAIILFARLYEYTNDTKWLDRAKACYDFVNEHLVDENGVILDNISNTGRIDYAKYTYNSGSFISGAMKLYEITKEQKYLDAAKHTASGSNNYFFKNSDRGYRTINMHSPWFNVLLLDGYIELYKHDKSALAFVEDFKNNLDYAYKNYLGEHGFMSTNWVGGGFSDKLNVLDMAANSENFGQLAHFYKDIFVLADA